MRRVLVSVLFPLVLVLAGCGNDDGGTVTDDPAPSPSTSDASGPSPDKGGPIDPVDFELVEILTETGAGGEVAPAAVPLGSADEVQQFASQFENDAMRTRLLDVVNSTEVPDDMLLYGAVVAIGCDAPSEVTVGLTDEGLLIAARPVPNPHQECFAPMTSVALVLVAADAVS